VENAEIQDGISRRLLMIQPWPGAGGGITITETGSLAFLVPLKDERSQWSSAISFSATVSEDRDHSSTVSSRPIETGVNITDHVFPQPETLRISGMVVGDDAKDRLEKLKSFWKGGQLLRYIGRVILPNVVIERFNDSYDNSISNGFRFNMTLKQVIIVDAPEFGGAGERLPWHPPDVPIPPPIVVKPVANFETDVIRGDAPLRVTFTDKTEWAEIDDGLRYTKWDYGTGVSDSEYALDKTRTYVYLTPGTYSPKLDVKNAFDDDSITKIDYITVTGLPAPSHAGETWHDILVAAIDDTITFEPDARRWRSSDWSPYTYPPEKIDDIPTPHRSLYFIPQVMSGYTPPFIMHTLVHTAGSLGTHKTVVMIYGTPFRVPDLNSARYAWVFLDVADVETEITLQNFNTSVKLHRIDTRLFGSDVVI
jgi:hypothetical protein